VKKDIRVYLAQIAERIDRIETYVAGGREEFFGETMIQDAVIRNFEVIGEAAKRVPDDYRLGHPEIPWRSLAALRDVLIHQYEGVSMDQVWQIVANDLPGLKLSIASILPPLDELERELSRDESSD
jgi:uncharacterized protein with HEPN domain